MEAERVRAAEWFQDPESSGLQVRLLPRAPQQEASAPRLPPPLSVEQTRQDPHQLVVIDRLVDARRLSQLRL